MTEPFTTKAGIRYEPKPETWLIAEVIPDRPTEVRIVVEEFLGPKHLDVIVPTKAANHFAKNLLEASKEASSNKRKATRAARKETP